MPHGLPSRRNAKAGAVEPHYWLERWQRNETGWHVAGPNPWLVEHAHRLNLAPGEKVFVPLCGKSEDLIWLRAQGWHPLGVELSRQAIEQFHAEHGLPAEGHGCGVLQAWESEALTIYCGDVFDLLPEDLHGAHAVWDRAALVALNPEQRKRYAAHLARLLPSGSRVLLVTFDYEQREMDGPPFAVLESEVSALFDANFTREALGRNDVFANNARFKERGMTRLLEEGWLLTRR